MIISIGSQPMIKKRGVQIEYRKLGPSFWTDPDLIDLTIEQRIFLIYFIIGSEAVNKKNNNTGIYQISRAVFQNIPFNFDLNHINQIIDFFNEEKPNVLEYDKESHIVFVKNFYRYNPHYGNDLSPVMADFKKTFHKVPRFWGEFVDRYRESLSTYYMTIPKLNGLTDYEKQEQVNFLDRLVEISNEIPDTEIKKAKAQKIKKEREIAYQI